MNRSAYFADRIFSSSIVSHKDDTKSDETKKNIKLQSSQSRGNSHQFQGVDSYI